MSLHKKSIMMLCFMIVSCVFLGLCNCSVCPQEPLCDCRPNSGMFDIYCTNLTSLEPVVKLLHSQFRNNTINKLMLVKNCGLTTLPDHAFENITLLILITSCPFSDIPEAAFHGTKTLTKIDLQNTNFSTIPNGLLNMDQLKTLNLKGNRVTALDHELWNLTSLLFLSISNGDLSEVSEDAFIKTPDIQYLDLSYNFLRHLSPDALTPLVSLQRINLRGNQLISVYGLFKHINPEVIDLYDNNLTSVDNVFHRSMWRLKSLNIGKNPISYLNSSAIKSMFYNLEIFDMSSMKFTQIDPDLFSSLPKLKKALLSRNRLQSIPVTLFHNLKSLNTIDLTDNDITSVEGIFLNNKQLKSILLGRNNISKIEHSFRYLTRLEKLYLGQNVIERIGDNDFEGLVSLESLILSHNRIESIESKSFSRLQNLSVLELSTNRLECLNKSVQNLFSLKELSVRSVNLKQVDYNEFLGLTKLSTLNLVNNKIISLDGAFRDARSLRELNIAKNKLVTLPRSTFPEKLKSIETLWLANGNKLLCDCRFSWMIRWLASSNYTVLKDNPLCHLPLRLRGKPIKKLTITDVTVWPKDCPPSCHCECIDQDTEFYVQVNCSYRNLTLMPRIVPQELGNLDLSGNELEFASVSNYSLTSGLINLNIERNKITNLTTDILDYVKELRVAGNLLKWLPWSVHFNDSLQVLTLANNPWICDCSAVDFKKWLISKGDIVADVNQTRCGNIGPYKKLYGRVITSLKDTDLCPSVISLYISLAIGILCALLLSSSMVLAYSKYHLYIKVWLYAHGYTWVKEDDMDTDKLFDALVSHHKNEEDFVLNEIAPRLEQEEPRFSLCVPQRDIVCGQFQVATEMMAVTDAKRTIVILTEEYMNDLSCMLIFQQAFEQSLEDKVPRIILIKMGDISKSEDMNSELKATLGSINCIPWGDRLFWERLHYAMPKKQAAKVNAHDGANGISDNSDESPLLG